METKIAELLNKQVFFNKYLDPDRRAYIVEAMIDGSIEFAFEAGLITEEERNELKNINNDLYDDFKFDDNDE